MIEIPLTIEELLRYGQFDEAERQAILSQVTEAILKKQEARKQAILDQICKPKPYLLKLFGR